MYVRSVNNLPGTPWCQQRLNPTSALTKCAGLIYRLFCRLPPPSLTTALSSSSSPLAGDAGRKATHIHHRITTLLSLSVPAYLLVPPSAMCSESCPPPAFASSVSSPRCPCEYHYRNFNAASVVADETFGAKHFTKPYCRTTVQVTQVQGREWRDTLVGRRGVNGGVGDTGG